MPFVEGRRRKVLVLLIVFIGIIVLYRLYTSQKAKSTSSSSGSPKDPDSEVAPPVRPPVPPPPPPVPADVKPIAAWVKSVQVIGPYGIAPWGTMAPMTVVPKSYNMSWIWASGAKDYNPDTKMARGPAWNPVYFLQNYDNTSGAAFDGRIVCQADDTVELSFNGTEQLYGDKWNVPMEIKVRVRPGINQIHAMVRVLEPEWGYGGFCCALLRAFDDEPLLVTDGTWRFKKFGE